MKREFEFSAARVFKAFLSLNFILIIITFLSSLFSKKFGIESSLLLFLIINLAFLYRAFSIPRILSIEIVDKEVSITYVLPLFDKHFFKGNISDITIEKNSEVGYRGSRTEILTLRIKDLQTFKIDAGILGWEKDELDEIEEVFNHS